MGHIRVSNSKSALVEEARRESRPASVFLLIRSLAFGGAQRQLVHLARGLQQRGHSVAVGVFYLPGPLMSDLEQAGVAIIDLGKSGRWDMIGFARRLRRAIADARPDVLYCFGDDANIVTGLLHRFLGGTKLVWSVRASDMDLSHYSWAHRLGYKLERSLSRSADLIISNSKAGSRFAVSNGFPAASIEVVPNGIDTECFRPDILLRRSQRLEWGLSDAEIAVGMLARLDPMKGHSDFLEAASKLASRRKELRFVCIGDGGERDRLKAMTASLGLSDCVLFPGSTIDPAKALNGLDIFCSASVWGEGFSNSVGEAMACGLRCVVTDVGDSAAIVGDEGIVVPPADPDALARAILAEADMLGTEFIDGRERIIENFSITRMVERTRVLLEAVVGTELLPAPRESAVVDDRGTAI